MLTIFELLCTAPAFFFFFAGVYHLFGVAVALPLILILFSFLIIFTWLCPKKIAKLRSAELIERRKEQTTEKIEANLIRVKSMPRPDASKTLPASKLLTNSGPTAPETAFKDQKAVVYVNNDHSL